MFVVDTNILVYASNEDVPEHSTCAALLRKWCASQAAWHLTWTIVYEYLSVSTHRGELSSPLRVEEAWRFIDRVLSSPGLEMLTETDRHRAVAQATLAEVPNLSGRHLHDAHVAILMREHGITRIVTRDTAFHRIPFLEVIDPLEGPWEVHESRPGGPHPSAIAKYGAAARGPRSPASRSRGRR